MPAPKTAQPIRLLAPFLTVLVLLCLGLGSGRSHGAPPRLSARHELGPRAPRQDSALELGHSVPLASALHSGQGNSGGALPLAGGDALLHGFSFTAASREGFGAKVSYLQHWESSLRRPSSYGFLYRLVLF